MTTEGIKLKQIIKGDSIKDVTQILDNNVGLDGQHCIDDLVNYFTKHNTTKDFDISNDNLAYNCMGAYMECVDKNECEAALVVIR